MMSSLLRLELQPRRFLKIHFEFAHISFFLSFFRSLTVIWNWNSENTFVHSHRSLENHTLFQNEMGKIHTYFQTKTAQKPYASGWHVQLIHVCIHMWHVQLSYIAEYPNPRGTYRIGPDLPFSASWDVRHYNGVKKVCCFVLMYSFFFMRKKIVIILNKLKPSLNLGQAWTPKFSQQWNIKCLKEWRKKLPTETVPYLKLYSFHFCTHCSRSLQIHHLRLKSIPFLYLSRDHLRSTMGIINLWG